MTFKKKKTDRGGEGARETVKEANYSETAGFSATKVGMANRN